MAMGLDDVMDAAGEGHTREELGVYVLGRLTPTAAAAVDRHLDVCADCAAQALELADVRDVLNRLEPEDIATLTARRHPSVAAQQEMAVPRSRSDAERAAGRPPARSAASRGPDNRAPARSSRALRPPAVLTGIVVALLLVAAGLGAVFALSPTQLALAGTGTSDQTGASISVTVRGSDRTCHLEADINGLIPQQRYRLLAIESDGTSRNVIEWTATTPDHRIAVDLALPAERLVTVSVTTLDGGVVVAVLVTAVS
jgi:hypothetical protein